MTETRAKQIVNKGGDAGPNTSKLSREVRRQSRARDRAARFAPGGVPRWIRVYDNEGESADRYTAIFTGRYPKGDGYNKEFGYRAMSGAPYHPQGVGIWGGTRYQPADTMDGKNGWKWPPAIGRKCHLGRRITFAELPEDCRNLVIDDYCELWGLDAEAVRALAREREAASAN